MVCADLLVVCHASGKHTVVLSLALFEPVVVIIAVVFVVVPGAGAAAAVGRVVVRIVGVGGGKW